MRVLELNLEGEEKEAEMDEKLNSVFEEVVSTINEEELN